MHAYHIHQTTAQHAMRLDVQCRHMENGKLSPSWFLCFHNVLQFFFVLGVNAPTIVGAGGRLIVVGVTYPLTMIILNLSHTGQLIVLSQTHTETKGRKESDFPIVALIELLYMLFHL